MMIKSTKCEKAMSIRNREQMGSNSPMQGIHKIMHAGEKILIVDDVFYSEATACE